MIAGHSAEVVIIGVEALCGLTLSTLDLRLLQLGPDRTYDARSHLVLQIEDILQRAIETVGPEMRPGGGVDELAGDTHLVCRLAHAPLEYVADAHPSADLPYIAGPPLVGKTRIARDHEHPVQTGQAGDDFF